MSQARAPRKKRKAPDKAPYLKLQKAVSDACQAHNVQFAPSTQGVFSLTSLLDAVSNGNSAASALTSSDASLAQDHDDSAASLHLKGADVPPMTGGLAASMNRAVSHSSTGMLTNNVVFCVLTSLVEFTVNRVA